MNSVKRLLGLVMLLLGVVGLCACLVGMYQVRNLRSAVVGWNEAGLKLCGGLMEKGDLRLNEIEETLLETRGVLKSVIQKADGLESADGSDPGPPAEIMGLLDGEVRQKIIKLRALVDYAATIADAANQLLSLLKDSGLKASKDGFQEFFLVNRIEALSQNLEEISIFFDKAFETARSLMDKPLSQMLRSRLKSEITQIDLKFGSTRKRLAGFETALQERRDQVVYYEEKAGKWVDWGVMLACFLLLWLGAGQFFLMFFGWKTIFKRQNAAA